MFVIFLAIWTAMHAYVFSRVASIPVVRTHVPLWAIWTIAVVLWPSYIFGRILSQRGPAAIGHWLEFAGATWVGVLFIALVCMFAADLVTGFGLLFKSAVPNIRATALLATVVLCAFATFQACRAPVVREYEVLMPNLPASSDGTKLVVASDLHLGVLLGPDWLSQRVAQIDSLRPDLIILAGDILEGDNQAQRKLLPGLKSLHAPLGVWAVTGNHEYYAGVDDAVAVLQEAGIKVLRDRWEQARPGLIVAGVDDLTVRRRAAREKKFVPVTLSGRPEGATILLSHTPLEINEAANAGVDLMLSGHTHNGQIWPFTYVVKLTYPHVYGDYRIGNMTLIVCRGTGTWGPRMRLWNRSELLSITLRRVPTKA